MAAGSQLTLDDGTGMPGEAAFASITAGHDATISGNGLLVMWTGDMNNPGGETDVFIAEFTIAGL